MLTWLKRLLYDEAAFGAAAHAGVRFLVFGIGAILQSGVADALVGTHPTLGLLIQTLSVGIAAGNKTPPHGLSAEDVEAVKRWLAHHGWDEATDLPA